MYENIEFKSMFREYDIRGHVNDKELNKQSVYDIVRAYASYLQKRNISRAVVGYDNRKCSPEFSKASIEALRDGGIDVFFVGLSISPYVYFAQYELKCEGAVMITASHNPDGWSGFKMGKGYSKTLEGFDIKEIYDILLRRDFVNSQKTGEYHEANVRDEYIKAVTSRIKINPEYRPKIVIDAGNGGAGIFAYEIFNEIGCKTFQLNCDPDDNYPHYFPNPTDLNARKRLREMVTHPYINADMGIGFDGDGDRIGVIDEKGKNIWSDKILIILSRQLLLRKKGVKIVFDVKCSKALIEDIESHGGTPVMWKTGNSVIKAKMQEINAELAGERSGHIFIGGDQYYGYDDALFAAAKVVEYLSYEQKPLSKILEDTPQYITSPEIYASCEDHLKYDIISKITEEFKSEYGNKVIDINGARIDFDDGWGLVRATSNTPELNMVFEAKSKERLLEIREIFKKKLSKYSEVGQKWRNDIFDN